MPSDRIPVNRVIQHKYGTTNFTCEVCGRVLTFCPNSQCFTVLSGLQELSSGVWRGSCKCGTVHWKGRTKVQPPARAVGGSCRILTTMSGMTCPLCGVSVQPGVLHECSK